MGKEKCTLCDKRAVGFVNRKSYCREHIKEARIKFQLKLGVREKHPYKKCTEQGWKKLDLDLIRIF